MNGGFTVDAIDKTPKEIVGLLDQYVIGQDEAKKAIAIALRNRYRRMQLDPAMQEEISPKNMLMIGPTGVGKTEIARRLAKIVHAPFTKVEASKFTEVGYVGRDVESMVRDLVEVSVSMQKQDQFKNVRADATQAANKRLVKLLAPAKKKENKNNNDFANMMNMFTQMQNGQTPTAPNDQEEVTDEIRNERLSLTEQLNQGLLENHMVEIEMDDPQQANATDNNMLGQMGIDLNDTLGSIMPKKRIKRTVTVAEAREILVAEESEKLVNNADINHDAIKRAENTGIIFLDEIDKIAKGSSQNSGDVSREGVQRDILPIVEGTQVKTKYGTIDTDHILFIAAGAFAESKPSDLIAELQGRFPIRVELNDLSKADFVRILTEPNNALIKQYIALIGTDNVKVTFTMEAIERIAELAFELNHENQNIGARRLQTVLEKLLEDLLYEGPDMGTGDVTITESYVNDKIGDIVQNKDLSRYIL
ncbi:HslU--HslV peptidase ATPase subunit [Levilactobacillus brevis]|jgi:ATP-dependent HslUV protease ATP-binding subunit HslU|uniref:ATP-dependent protease ATPase subunit HslU n=2 Tax=Levilactobacillus brevis TaxID=1580 RepID=Q03S78_LEVBA|nr:ATP-dependent protease ATPase subunit HslU [Levilactobacillus brevis]ABJ63944.1 ATP-dependent protease HslVU (ClpYQ), ATPase subunit [Levilactobacillus brevis ATCC 367]AJA79583.1 ATP-dependent protease [Levilactobacillus brevis BSO 464]BAN06811.1 ATP-dependent protease ATPase subunit HslU [Levilactobacillus brevis KB290]ANN49080.1 HslU--HslV peptidase ATPase subunit [Levilactobacillus brevis]ARN92599.1 ATP-dependent protease ATP-binding subunit HslU [Levilactobacillus brevis]